jgi:hypothetical protein
MSSQVAHEPAAEGLRKKGSSILTYILAYGGMISNICVLSYLSLHKVPTVII